MKTALSRIGNAALWSISRREMVMSRRLMVMGALAISMTLGACAHSGAPATTEIRKNKSVYVPPQLSSGMTQLSMRTRGGPIRGTIEIPIDASGHADANAIRSTGSMDDLMRQSIREWLEPVTFTPATRDGVPVAGVFTMRFR